MPQTVVSYRSRSLWLDQVLNDAQRVRQPLPGPATVDVAIVGAGFTGLWTAYYLKQRDPTIRVAMLEAETAGFGASGRNGGWCSAILPVGLDTLAAGPGGRDGAIAMQRAMNDTVDEVARATIAAGIDCDFQKGGYVHLARHPVHLQRIQDSIAEARRFGFEDPVWLDRDEATTRVNATGVLGASYTPHCAAIHPAKLVRGLAAFVESQGVTIYEQTRVAGIETGIVRTERGDVRADVVVRATEGYTPNLPGEKRTVVPIYSLMIATEPLPATFWAGAGFADRETFNDARNMIIYGQRTADGRLAFGGRGALYHYGSRIRDRYDSVQRVHEALHRELVVLFPALRDARITHRWGGPLAIARDWHPSVGFDRLTGLASAGGYVGDGVATTNLAGRTLADLITGTNSSITELPWVNHHSRQWEHEPFRYLGANAGLLIARRSDAAEQRTGNRSRRWTWAMNKLRG
jgi:glycine/D-amino acid oxidase-like deaminating enzyme